MRPILSSTGTYNNIMSLPSGLKKAETTFNEYTISDAFVFANEIHDLSINEDDVLDSLL